MLVKLKIGVGSFGKLWTGTELRPAHEAPKTMLWDGEKAISNIVDAFIIERTCECGASTRKFRAVPVEHSPEALAALEIQECFITAGGVGSISGYPTSTANDLSPDIRVHNWSGRVGGHVIMDPLMVLSGYVSRDDLPTAKPGYGWVCTYRGSTVSEYVLLPVTVDAPTGPLGWGLPTVKLSGTCPPCRKKAVPPVELANDGQYALTYDGQFKAGCRVFDTKEQALAHWGGRDDDRAKVFTEAITNFVEPAFVEPAFVETATETPRRERGERGDRGERAERRRRPVTPASDCDALFAV